MWLCAGAYAVMGPGAVLLALGVVLMRPGQLAGCAG
jgi:hypothetical protein